MARNVALYTTSINMQFYKVNDVLYDQWYKKLENIGNLNKKQKNIQTNKFHTCIKNMTKFINCDA